MFSSFQCRLRSLSLLGALTLSLIASGRSDVITLRFAASESLDGQRICNRLIAEYEASHPNIRIERAYVSDGGTYFEKILLMFAAKLQPDVVLLTAGDQVPLATRGAIQDLKPFLNNSSGIQQSDYFPNSIEMLSFEHHVYALPRSLVPTGLIYYNRQLFREAGVAYPSPDWTWSLKARPKLKEHDFVWVMERLTKRNGNKVTQYGMGVSWPQLWFFTLLKSSGLSAWDSNEHPTKMTANDPKVVDLMQFVSDTVYKDRFLPNQNDLSGLNTNSHDQFVQGKLAMFQSGSWEVGNFAKQIKGFDWDVVPFPAHEGDAPQALGNASGLAMITGTKHPREAWEFMKFMSGPRAQTLLAQAGMEIPSLRALASQPGIWLAKDPNSQPKGIPYTVLAASSEQKDIVPDWFQPITEDVQSTAYHVLNSERPVRQTMEQLQSEGTQLIDFAQKRRSRPPYPTGAALAVGAAILGALLLWLFWPSANKPTSRRERTIGWKALPFLLPWILGLSLVLGPMLYSLLISFAETDLITAPKFAGIENYTDAFKVDTVFPISLRQTFIFAAMSVPVSTMAALAFALLLNQTVPAIRFFRGVYYIPSLVSGVAMSLIWLRVFNPESGLLNYIVYGPDGRGNFLGIGHLLSWLAGTPGKPVEWLTNPRTVLPAFVMMGAWGAGGGAIIFLAGLQGISQTYYEAAMIDGANALQRLKNVTIPLLTPTTFFVLTTGIIGAFQIYTESVVMTQGGEPDHATEFYMVHLVAQAFNYLKIGYANALAWILFVIILIVTVIQLRMANRWVFYEGGDSA